MLGYVLHLPVANLVGGIDGRLRKHYGESARIEAIPDHPQALSLQVGNLSQSTSGHTIRLLHIFVDMTRAAAA